ncbi:MAG: hypothetical protein D6819_01895 [Gammaproteobacteria bacterium]|nr:MAG: hypothetical protein D6819_01895 [Gammaproteobacteria bacterium]
MKALSWLAVGILAVSLKSAQGVAFHIDPHRPSWVEAFYLARGLPRSIAHAISQACVFHVRMENRSQAPIHVRVERWRIKALGKERPVKGRKAWDALLKEAPKAARASFYWTLFPDDIILQPGEGIMGIAIFDLPPGTPFSLTVSWQEDGEDVALSLSDLRCPTS